MTEETKPLEESKENINEQIKEKPSALFGIRINQSIVNWILIGLFVVCIILITIDIIHISSASFNCVQDPKGYLENVTGTVCNCVKDFWVAK